MSIEPGALDANILIYATDAASAQHAASRALLDAAGDPATLLYVTSQVLCEFYSIVTNSRRVAAPRTSVEAINAISSLLARPGVHLLPTPTQAVAKWIALVKRNPVLGANVFDLQLVATMQANNIQRIYTFNPSDFEVFSELIVVTPE